MHSGGRADGWVCGCAGAVRRAGMRACKRARVPAYLRMCVHVWLWAGGQVGKQVCGWTSGSMCVHACVCACMRAYVRVCVCMCMRACVRACVRAGGRAGGWTGWRVVHICMLERTSVRS